MKARFAAGMAGWLAGLLLTAGCATTPASRIRAQPELFASFPAETQEQIRAGRVAIGYTEDMVRMALGAPDRVFRREAASGATIVWSYSDSLPITRYDYVPITHTAHDSRGRLQTYPNWMMVDRTVWHEIERMRLDFRDGRVVAIETETPR